VTTLQCVACLKQLETESGQLSKPTVSRLIGLPHLHTLRAGSDPPFDPVVPSDIFPSLEALTPDGGVGHKWLSFLGATQKNCSTDGDLRTPENGTRATGTDLHCLDGTTVDPDFVSSPCIVQKLTHMSVDSSCSEEGGCTTDDDVTRLANTLPDIKSLRLGSPCSVNRYHTTPFSLLTLSTRCLKLKALEVHFNTTNIGRGLDWLFKEIIRNDAFAPEVPTSLSNRRRHPNSDARCCHGRDLPFRDIPRLTGVPQEMGGSFVTRSGLRSQVAPDTLIVSMVSWHLFLSPPPCSTDS